MSGYTSEAFQSKVESAAKVIETIPGFVAAIRDSEAQKRVTSPHEIACEYIWKRLGMLGIYKDADSHAILMSDDCTEGEARRAFCENGDPNLPPVRFKRVWSILRESKQEKAESKGDQGVAEGLNKLSESIKESLRPVGQWKDKELIEVYGPECDPEIVHALQERSHGRPFIAFSDEKDLVVDVELSLRMLREARRRETPVNYQVADCLKRLYPAGEFPHMFYYECPFHKGTLLVEGFCDQAKVMWSGVDYECMQFARIAQELDEIGRGKPSMRQFVNTARQEGVDGLRKDYPHVALVFDERKEEGDLPSLKIRMSDTSSRRVADPMNPGKQRW